MFFEHYLSEYTFPQTMLHQALKLSANAQELGGDLLFRVRLGFSALPGDQPGQRVFDVLLNGKTVLQDFDILSESGQPDSAVWKVLIGS